MSVQRSEAGRKFSARVDAPFGSAGSPMRDCTLQDWVRRIAAPVVGATRTEAPIARFWKIDGLVQVADLAESSAVEEG